jgi:hypothetical protein
MLSKLFSFVPNGLANSTKGDARLAHLNSFHHGISCHPDQSTSLVVRTLDVRFHQKRFASVSMKAAEKYSDINRDDVSGDELPPTGNEAVA